MSEILTGLFQNNHSGRTNSSLLGERGEELAAKFLTRNGFRLVIANFKAPIGRTLKGVAVSGEIDIIAVEKTTICFVEVKTRTSDEFASPLSAVDLRKQRQIIRTARVYRKIFNIRQLNFRYDVVTIVTGKSLQPKIELFRNFWTEAKFRKRSWNEDF